MTLAARINRGFGRAQGPSVGSKTLPSREETFRRPKRYSYTNRLKSQIKHVIMWHYIFAKYLTRSNNINDLYQDSLIRTHTPNRAFRWR